MTPGALDPITLAVLKGRLEQIADEMDATLFRSAFNPIIAEARDASHGIYDAITHYQATTQVKAPDLNSLPPGLRPNLPAPKPRPDKTSFRVVPMFSPSGAGIGLSWEH